MWNSPVFTLEVQLLLNGLEWAAFLYLITINVIYITLNLAALFYIRRYARNHSFESLPPMYLTFAPPVSILVPVFNEEKTVDATVRSLLNLIYPELEIVVINDGSSDQTLDRLKAEFDLIPFSETYHQSISTQPIRGIYRSRTYLNLRVIDKINGKKADALNAGLNAARHPLVCCVDGDSILQPDSLIRVTFPFMEDPLTIASGGVVRIANGCRLEDGLIKPGLPHNIWALYQVVEYLRAFLFGRLGWSILNSVLIISGTFGVFRRDLLLEIGGYDPHTVGEDMELVVRLHHHMRLKGQPYRIRFVPDPICWTEVPEDLGTLRNQRIRWQRGLAESLFKHTDLLFHPKSGTVGWLAFPFMLFFELLGPVIELFSFFFILFGFYLGVVSPAILLGFLAVVISVSLILSTSTLLLEELSFHVYNKPSDMLKLFFAIVTENFGYRQITLIWRIIGLGQWLMHWRNDWGTMKRRATIKKLNRAS